MALQTINDLRNDFAKSERAFQIAWAKSGNSGFAKNRPVSQDEISRITSYYEKVGTNSVSPKANEVTLSSTTNAIHSPNAATTNTPVVAAKKWPLYLLMAAPAIASIQNMHAVTGDLTADFASAALLTGLFSLSPFLFVLSGLNDRRVKILTVALIVYECFCNTIRIYGGLTNFGKSGLPTRFLGLVTDFFNTGTFATARVLAVFMAVLAAAVFYAAYTQLNKRTV